MAGLNSESIDRERRIEAAIRAIGRERNLPIAAVARQYSLSRTTLSDRLKGAKSRSQRRPKQGRLTDREERSIVIHCTRLDHMGAQIHYRYLKSLANSLLESREPESPNAPPPPPVSDKWPKRFLQRHPEIEDRIMHSIDVQRKAAHDPVALDLWYKDYEGLINEFGIQKEDIWNMDETFFRIGKGNSQRVIVDVRCKRRNRDYIPSTSSLDYITCMEATSANGDIVAPYIILKGNELVAKWYDEELELDTLLAVSDSGYTDDILTFQWIKHFERLTGKRQAGIYRLLLCDGFNSHYTIDFLQFCDEHNIKVVCLPAHVAHLMQPLDIIAFGEDKQLFSRIVDEACIPGCTDLNRLKFLADIRQVRATIITPGVVRASFRKAGLWPVNNKLVTDALREKLHAGAASHIIEALDEAFDAPDSRSDATPLT